MFTIHDEAYYDPETDELQRFYGPAENPEPEPEDRCAECDAPVYEDKGWGRFCSEDAGHICDGYEPDPDAQLEEYHWRLSSL